MHIVGVEIVDGADNHVHTIDLWYSARRERWVVERLNRTGDLVGHAHCCESEDDATACLAAWLRQHDETHMVTPREVGHTRQSSRRIAADRKAA